MVTFKNIHFEIFIAFIINIMLFYQELGISGSVCSNVVARWKSIKKYTKIILPTIGRVTSSSCTSNQTPTSISFNSGIA